jgi:hypothetical protein
MFSLIPAQAGIQTGSPLTRGRAEVRTCGKKFAGPNTPGRRITRSFILPLTLTRPASGLRLQRPYALTTWPRISPPLFASVWTLAYNMPFCRSSA